MGLFGMVLIFSRDPFFEKTFIFEAERLKGAKTPPPTLRRGDWTERGARGGGRGYRPQIGFTRNVPQASFGRQQLRF